MGNKFTSCGCQKNSFVYSDSPYSKQMSKNLIRFWAEVFLLAQEGSTNQTRWQKVVPKLVPVNVAKVQEAPAVVSHITAYNTKVDKVMDTLVFHPGVDLFRGSDCFVYWCDPQNGLTWGLNFITNEDAAFFVEILDHTSQEEEALTTHLRKHLNNGHVVMKSDSTANRCGGSSDNLTSAKMVKFADDDVSSLATNPPSFSKLPSSIGDVQSQTLVVQKLGSSQDHFEIRDFSAADRRSRKMSFNDEEDDIPAGRPCCSTASQLPIPQKVSIPCQYSDNDQQGVDDEKHGLSRSLPNVHHPIYKKHRSPLTLDLDCHQTEASSSSNAISTSTMTTQQTRKKNSLSIWRLQGANTPADDGTSATLQGEMQFGGSTDHRTRDGGIVLEPETSDQYGEIGHHPTEPTSMWDDDTPKSECSVILTQNQRTIPLTPTTDWKRSSLHLTTLGKINDDKPYPSSSSPTYCSIKKGPASKEHPTTDFPPPPPPEVGVGSKFTMLKRNLVEDLKDSSSVSSSSSSKHSSESVLTKSGHVKIRSWNFEDIQSTTPREIDDWRPCFAVAEDRTLTFHFSYKYSKKSDKDSASSPNPNESASNEPLCVDLKNCLAQTVLPTSGDRPHVFCLAISDGRCYLVEAQNDEDMMDWINVIHSIAGLLASESRDIYRAISNLKNECEKRRRPAYHGSANAVDEELALKLVTYDLYLDALRGRRVKLSRESMVKNTSSTSGASKLAPLCALYSKMTVSKRQNVELPVVTGDHYISKQKATSTFSALGGNVPSAFRSSDILVQIKLPDSKVLVTRISEMDTVESVLKRVCNKASLKSDRCFLLLKKLGSSLHKTEISVPEDREKLQVKTRAYDVEIKRKKIYHTHLHRNQSTDGLFGLTIRAAQTTSNNAVGYSSDESINIANYDHIIVSNIRDDGEAKKLGLCVGDEILALNGQKVKSRTITEMESLIKTSQTLCLVARTKRDHLPLKLDNFFEYDNFNDNSDTEAKNLPCQTQVRRWQNADSEGSSTSDNNSVSTRQQFLGGFDSDQEQNGRTTEDDSILLIKNNNNKQKPTIRLKKRWTTKQYKRRSLPNVYYEDYSYQLKDKDCDYMVFDVVDDAFEEDSNTSGAGCGAMDKLGNYCDPIWDDDGIVASTSALKMEEPEFETGDGKNFNRSKMNVIEKLDRIVHELVETETVFVKDLENLIRTYVQPLQVQLFLPPNDVNRLAASCASMLNFQKEFLEELQEASSPCSELEDDDGRAWSNRAGTRFPFRSAENLKYAILRISCVFCNAAAKFKKYSPYCAIYLHIQTVLKIDQNLVLQKFLHSLNIKREHSETFESYLIKPVQRILRYPLFLKEISSLCSSPAMMQALTKCQQQQRENNNQFYKYLLNKIKNACEKMEKVAEYINEMQRIYEQYGHLFDQAQCLYKSLRDKISLEVSELIMFGEVCWLNATDEMMHKTSNGLYSNNGRVSSSNITRSIECLCFVFKSALLLAVNDKLQKRRKYSKNFERGSSTTRNSTTAYVSVYRVIPMDELKVSGDDVSSKNNDKFVWIIIHRPNASSMERIYYLSNRRLEVKLQFLKSVKKAQQLLNKSCSNNNVPRTELCPAVLCSSTKNISRSSNLHSSNTISAEYSPANNNYYPIIRSSTDKNVSHRSSQSDTGYGGSLSDLHKRISYD